jgi:hypothetical protein
MSNRLLRTGGSSYMGSLGQDSSSTLVVRGCLHVLRAGLVRDNLFTLLVLSSQTPRSRVPTGQIEAYASMEADMVAVLKGLLVNEIFFWPTLWAVKLSLLCMFQKLTIGLSTYTRIWWGVIAFTIIIFVGCVISALRAVQVCMLCSARVVRLSLHNSSRTTLPRPLLTVADECSTPRDEIAMAASLWYGFAADFLTDLVSNLPRPLSFPSALALHLKPLTTAST